MQYRKKCAWPGAFLEFLERGDSPDKLDFTFKAGLGQSQ